MTLTGSDIPPHTIILLLINIMHLHYELQALNSNHFIYTVIIIMTLLMYVNLSNYSKLYVKVILKNPRAS